jgi:hypothetical protein
VNDNTNKIFPTTPFQSSFYKKRHFVLGGSFGKMVMPFWSVQLEFKLANISGRNYKTGQEIFSYLNNEIAFITNIDILKIANLKPIGRPMFDWALASTDSNHDCGISIRRGG